MGLTKSVRQIGRYAIGIAGLRGEDILFCSYPRSGSTWMRFLLCNYLSLLEWEGRRIDFDTLNEVMVELGVNNLLASWPYQAFPRVVKTHRPYSIILKRPRAVGLVRDPRDVMVSYYHFLRDRKGIYHRSFHDFIRDTSFGLPAWFRHYQSWYQHWSTVTTYEAMRSDPESTFTTFLRTLGVEPNPTFVAEAVQRSGMENVRSLEGAGLSSAAHPDAQFARSGRSGQWQEFFTSEDLSYFERLIATCGGLNPIPWERT